MFSNRLARLMGCSQIKALRGYKAPRNRVGRPAVTANHQLNRELNYAEPNKAWVTDISYIRTYEGFLYLAVILDLHSRRVIGWSMKVSMAKKIVIEVLLMANWRRSFKQPVIIYFVQGSQFSSDEWNRFLSAHSLFARGEPTQA